MKKTSIIMDAMLYIYKLKLQIEAIKQEYQCLINNIQVYVHSPLYMSIPSSCLISLRNLTVPLIYLRDFFRI